MTHPLVSIIIPTYNYAQYIIEAIESVQNQSYPKDRIEIIIIDDGSTDTTQELISSRAESGNLIYIYQKNQGKAQATKIAIQQCTGKYIFNLDADDYFLPEKITQFVNVFESDSKIVHVASSAQMIDGNKYPLGVENIPKCITDKIIEGNSLLNIFYDNNILFGGGSTYAAKAIVLQSIDIPVSVNMYIDEFLILALLPHGSSYIFGSPLSVWRIHFSNYSIVRGSKKQILIRKSLDAISASDSILSYIKSQKFDENLIKIYTLKNITNRIAHKEVADSKTIIDILKYIYKIVFEIGIHPKWFRKYYVINRLLPLSVFRLMKKIKSS